MESVTAREGILEWAGEGARGLNRSRKCKSSSGVPRTCASEKILKFTSTEMAGNAQRQPGSCTLTKIAIIKESKLKATRGIRIHCTETLTTHHETKCMAT